jgi:hypothetical protein
MFGLFGLSKAYKISPEEQRTTLLQTRDAAVRENQPEAVAVVDEALPRVDRARELQHGWDFQNAFDPVTEDTQLLDAEIDAIVGQIHDIVAGFARRAKGTELGRTAARLLADAFPKGLSRHLHASYREQAGLHDALVKTLGKPEYAAFVGERGLERLRQELAEHNARFTKLVAPTVEIKWADVVAARNAAQEATLRAIMRIGAAYDGADPEQARIRDVLLLPFVELMDAIRRANREKVRVAKARAAKAVEKAAEKASGKAAATEAKTEAKDTARPAAPTTSRATPPAEAKDAAKPAAPATPGATPATEAKDEVTSEAPTTSGPSPSAEAKDEAAKAPAASTSEGGPSTESEDEVAKAPAAPTSPADAEAKAPGSAPSAPAATQPAPSGSLDA